MDGNTPRAARQHTRQRRVVVHQQAAGRSPHEDLHASRAGNTLQFLQRFGIVRRRTDIKGMVAPHPVMRAIQLFPHPLCTVGVGVCVGHFKDRGDPAQHSRPAARFKVFLMLQPRLTEMHLTVDAPRQHVEARTIDHLARIAQAGPDRHDLARANSYVRIICATGGVNGAVLQDQVESLGHGMLAAWIS